MKKINNYILLLAVLFVCPSVFGQNNAKESLESGTLSSQFNYMINNSNRYMDFKVIKMAWLEKYSSNVSDSLNLLRNEILGAQNRLLVQVNEIEVLNTQLKNLSDDLTSIENEKNSIELLGLQIDKNKYINTLWTLLAVLIILLIVFIFRFRRSNLLTLESKNLLAEIREEFDGYRKRALEKEQKLGRELQNELNKTKRF
ncbi:MAG: tRNA (guanine-N1)-methyltransferase [Bacteroidetes bacterium]|nr:tRNA (guanine-N1)-methyltransferase [Bacteroidota bacterium]HET6244079.1 tRNA (guanine-N1)-methyltransferase [Bacteroidia bacterium]